MNEQGELVCASETSLTDEQLLELYRYLRLTRLVEEKLVNLYRQTKIVGGVFRSLGQEATAVGTCYALESRDFIAPLIRDLGAVLVAVGLAAGARVGLGPCAGGLSCLIVAGGVKRDEVAGRGRATSNADAPAQPQYGKGVAFC